ncbi:MAG: sugar nucleotide-binding protein [Verrucomicrobiota bacterium]
MIIILGGSGYVGSAFCRFFEERGIEYRNISRRDCDYTRSDCLEDLIEQVKPSVLINAAGYTGKPNVDACEVHKTECLDGNAVLPGMIQEVCSRLSLPWGHVSSGCIFTGRHATGEGFSEYDVPNFSFRENNCSFYSGCKVLGEEAMGFGEHVHDGKKVWSYLREGRELQAYVWRLRIPFNEVNTPRNYLSKIMKYPRLLDAENSISQLEEFVEACWQCWEKRVPYGVYNVTNPGVVTAKEIVQLITEERNRRTSDSEKEWFPDSFDFFEDEDEFMRTAAKTPRSNCVLQTDRLESVGIKLREVNEAVELALRNWKP